MDYGFRGLMLMVLFYLFCQKWWISLPGMVAYMGWWGLTAGYELFDVRFGIQMFAMLALPLIYIHTKSKLKITNGCSTGSIPPIWSHPAARPAGNVSERRARMNVALIVPAYKPTKDMLPMLERFSREMDFTAVVVDDGSGDVRSAV